MGFGTQLDNLPYNKTKHETSDDKTRYSFILLIYVKLSILFSKDRHFSSIKHNFLTLLTHWKLLFYTSKVYKRRGNLLKVK